MESFIVSQSEALLIGRCLELYLQQVSDRPGVRFTNRVSADIGSFLPQSGSLIKYHLKPEVPQSVEWIPPETDGIGYSPEHPQSVFYRSNASAEESMGFTEFEVERIDSTKTLEFLVIELVRDVLDPSLDAVRNTLPPTQWGRASYDAFIQKALKSVDASKEKGEADPPFLENGEEIENRLLSLVSSKENDHRQAFECGRKFGRVEADYRRGIEAALEQLGRIIETPDDDYDPYSIFQNLSEQRVEHWQPMMPVEWHQNAGSELSSLIQQREFPLGSLSEQLLEKSRQDHNRWKEFDESEAEEFIEPSCLADLHLCNEYLQRLAFAFGDLIGRSNVSDDETRRRDVVSPVPRMFRLSPTSTADRIRGSLELAEKWLASDDAHNALGPTIVSSLGPSVEALARRNWPEDFTDHRPKLGRILDQRRNGSDVEQRFVSIAKSLYNTYRNPTSHQFDSVSCSPIEALFFFNGVRVLLQLSDTICASRRKES